MTPSQETLEKFFTDTSHTGRHVVQSFRTGRKYFIEPLDGNRVKWGDIDPATNTLQGSYGSKYKGSIDKSESLITKENGFVNINIHPPGMSPYSIIEQLDAAYPDKEK